MRYIKTYKLFEKSEYTDLEELVHFMMDWLGGGAKFEQLKKEGRMITTIIKKWPQFAYSGKGYRLMGSDITTKPVDFNSAYKSFSKSMVGIATTLEYWEYGGMIEGETDDLPVYVQDINNGLDVPKVIKFIEKIIENMSGTDPMWVDDWIDMIPSQYLDSEEVISRYNRQNLGYVIHKDEVQDTTPFSFKYYHFIDPKQFAAGKRAGKKIRSKAQI